MYQKLKVKFKLLVRNLFRRNVNEQHGVSFTLIFYIYISFLIYNARNCRKFVEFLVHISEICNVSKFFRDVSIQICLLFDLILYSNLSVIFNSIYIIIRKPSEI